MGEKPRIGVIGSYAVGMTIACDHFPVAGETVPGRDFKAMHGGKGSNQAVAAARLGAEVFYGTCVGKDSFGDMCFDLYKQEGINSEYITRSKTGMSTGVGLIYVNRDGENEIVIDFAANNEYGREDIDRIMPLLKDCRLLLMQLEMSLDTITYAAKRCREAGVDFVLNPAPYQKIPDELLRCCDYLIPNQTEGRLLLGLQADDEISDEKVAQWIYKLGVKHVILTLGAGGALIVDEKGSRRVPGIPARVVDTTGAGDTFSAAFCVALARGESIDDAAAFGNRAAGLSVTKYGVIESIPYAADL